MYLAKQEGVEIVLNGDDLNVRIPKNQTTNKELIDQIRANKQAIIEVLSNNLFVKKAHDTIHPADKSGITFTPLSFSQERLWFIHQKEGSLQYHLTRKLLLNGSLNIAALEYAIKNVVKQHEILHTVILENDGQPYQQLIDPGSWSFQVVNLLANNNEKAVDEAVAQQAGAAFDLERDYMLRASLFTPGNQKHMLLLTMHHIAADGWSFPIVVKEIIELYQRFESGNDQPLPPMPVQFSDFAIWERKQLTKETLDKKIGYWKEKLKEVAPLQLPTDFARPMVRKGTGASVNAAIGNQLKQQLVKLANQQGATLYMVLLSAFKVLLHRYSNQADICVGASIANRSRDEVKDMVGFFVNTLSFRSHLEGDKPFTDLLQQVKKTTLEAYQHQDIPFEKVVEAVLTERDQSRTPVFQVMLVLNNTPATPSINVSGLEIIPVDEAQALSKFDLTFFVAEKNDGLNINVVYSTELFLQSTMTDMLQYFTTLLQSLVDAPTQQVGLLKLLSDTNESALLQGLASSLSQAPLYDNPVQQFDAQVLATPHKTAVVFEGHTLSFSALNAKSNQLASLLLKKIATPNAYVPIFLDRSVDTVISIIGILKAGFAYVPIEVDLPDDRVDFILKDINAGVILTSKNYAERLQKWAHVIKVLVADDQLLTLPADDPAQTILGSQVAYVIYTSGSTGQPKGVMVQHCSIVDYVAGLNEKISIDKCASYALVSSFATDLGNTVVFSALLLGGTLHLISKQHSTSSHYLLQYFTGNQIDCLKIVPSHWKALSHDGALLLPKKQLIFGGEVLSPQTVLDIYQANTSCTVINHYGPTETTIGKLLHVVHPNYQYRQSVPVGRPFGQNHVAVLSNQMQVCPPGVPGQLYIGGKGVARGYLNNGNLTRQKFVPVTLGKTQAAMYATGDLVKILATGEIQFLGRIDEQVKIRGYRVEPGEIENVLRKMPEVQLCSITAPADDYGVCKLIAYIVGGSTLTQQEVINFLSARLPEYMVPPAVVFLPEMPLTINGKIDKKSLPDPYAIAKDEQVYSAPRNNTEEKLAEIWQQILEVEPIGIYNDFFSLGGHSLLAVRVISLIRKEFKVEVPISHIFDFPTIALLAQQLITPGNQVVLASIPAVNPRPANIPLSFSQERLWFIDQMEGTLAYHVPAVLRITGDLNTRAIASALKAVVERHEVLRTVYVSDNDQVFQQVRSANKWALEMQQEHSLINNRELQQQRLQQLINQPFNLATDYMMRATLLEVANNDYLLVLTLHHIASDGWSRAILVKEIVAFYKAFTNNLQPNLLPLPIQYADYAIWLSQNLTAEILNEKLSYWKNKLAGVEHIQFPTQRHVQPGLAKKTADISFTIDKVLVNQAKVLAQQQGCSLFMVMLAAFKITLYKYTGQTDICVGTPYAGRQQQELEPMIGFFLNLLAIRTNITSNQPFATYLQQLRTTVMEAFQHQEVPFEKVVEAVVVNREAGVSPLFQVMFMFQNTPEKEKIQLDKVSVTPQYFEADTARYHISVAIAEQHGSLVGTFEYDSGLYDLQTMTQFLHHYQHLLHLLVSLPAQPVSSFLPLSPAQLHHLIFELNDTAKPFPVNKTIRELFEERATEIPEQPALIFNNHCLTYSELNNQANHLAATLVLQGVTPGTVIPIFIERSVEMIVGLLAIAKAGGIYVPIDPDYPQERIQFILNDVNAGYIVTSQQISQQAGIGSGAKVIIVPDAGLPVSAINNLPSNTVTDADFCIVYTSGSSGKPKGVGLTNANMLNRIYWNNDRLPFKPNERVALKTSIGFVDHISEIFSTLLLGATGVLFTRNDILDTETFLQKLTDNAITRWVLVPSLLEEVLDMLLTKQLKLPLLTCWMCSGEALNSSLVKRFYHQFPSGRHRLLNIYGSSEVSADVTCYDTFEDFLPAGGSGVYADTNVPIGKPIANCQVYILDKDDSISPKGCYGEICIGGLQVANGYVNNAALTAEKFINLEMVPAGKIYRTGDIGRWLPDNNIEYAGRVDDQVKINGIRVEPREVEQVLIESGLVKQAIVVSKKDAKGKYYLAAYIVADQLNKMVLRQHLAARLPGYMLPAAYVHKEALPLTASGKVDRNKLKNEPLSINTNVEYKAPVGDTEIHLTQIWQHILKQEKVGVDDNFFEIGGHSLLIVKMVSGIRRQFGITVPIPMLFQLTTVAALANYIHWQLTTVTEEDPSAIETINF